MKFGKKCIINVNNKEVNIGYYRDRHVVLEGNFVLNLNVLFNLLKHIHGTVNERVVQRWNEQFHQGDETLECKEDCSRRSTIKEDD